MTVLNALMSATALEVDESIDFDVPCSRGEDEGTTCHVPARWIARRKCCNSVSLYCNKHKNDMLNFLAVPGGVVCVLCDKVTASDQLMVITPLKD